MEEEGSCGEVLVEEGFSMEEGFLVERPHGRGDSSEEGGIC